MLRTPHRFVPRPDNIHWFNGLYPDNIANMAVIFMLLVMFAAMLATPVCLGMLLRLVIRQARPRFVGWFGAALVMVALYGAGSPMVPMNSVADALPFGRVPCWGIMFDSGIPELLFPLVLAFLLVTWGVVLVDRQTKQRSERFWLIVCPLIAGTVYVGLRFVLMCLCLSVGDPVRFSGIFSFFYRFFWLEFICVLVVAFLIARFYLKRNPKPPPVMAGPSQGVSQDAMTH